MSVFILRGCVVSEDLWLRLTARLKMKQDSKKLKRKLLYLTTIILTLAGCASEDYVGNHELHEANENGRPVSFGLVAAPQTRAVYGGEAAGLLNNNFIIWGEKTMSDNSVQTVFNNYQVNYVTNTANTTTSNTAGWEYVGYHNLPDGVSVPETGDNIGVVDIPAYANSSANSGSIDQTIKFWDYGASKYNFFAYSLGQGVEVSPATDPKTYTYAKVSAMTSSGYTVSGTGDQLKASYISNKKMISPSGSTGTEVELQFRNFASKVKMAFYETVPGYSVNDVKFYPSASGSAAYVPTLYASDDLLPTAGTYNITFEEDGKAKVSSPTSATKVANLAFGDVLTYTAAKEYLEPQDEGTTPYIGRTSDAATPTTMVTVLPNPNGTDLYLKVDYTLVSRDFGETIKVKGATAVVPAVYAQWQPNYSYTYLFKISDNVNGSTGQSIPGLSPITLDAVVNVSADGTQETVTTLTDQKSITTYQYGSYVAGIDEYYASDYVVEGTHTSGPIYIVVNDKTTGLVSLTTTNVKLYSATVESGAVQGITEATVANALKVGTYNSSAGTWTVTDANSKALVVTALPTALTQTNSIAAADSPDGNAVVFHQVNEGDPEIYKAVQFTPSAGTTYVFEYIDTSVMPNVNYYKVIKVKE